MKGLAWYNVCKRFEKLKDKDKLAFLSLIKRVYPWHYLVGPMSPAERRFYDPKAKRPTKKKK